MRSRLLQAICFVSLVLLGVLGCGYFGTVALLSVSAARAGVPAQVPVTGFGAENGRVVFVSEQRPAVPAGPGYLFSLKPGIHPLIRFRPFRLPDFRRIVGHFECHRIKAYPGSSLLIVGCPIWCAALPFLIAPALWLKRQRKRRVEPAGFCIIQKPPSRSLGAS